MSGRNRRRPSRRDTHYALVRPPPGPRRILAAPHPVLLEQIIREPPPPPQFKMMNPRRTPPPNPAIFEDRIAAQRQEIQGLLMDNQRLAASHLALKQDLEAANDELRKMARFSATLRAEKDAEISQVYEKSRRLEVDLLEMDAMKDEIRKLEVENKELGAAKQELTGQVQSMRHQLGRAGSELQHVRVLKADIEGLNVELKRARATIEFEKKGSVDNYENSKLMEKNLIKMARELEMLRAQIAANAENNTSAADVVRNTGHNGNYGDPEAGYRRNPYSVQRGTESYSQYGPGSGLWGAYDTQRAQGHR